MSQDLGYEFQLRIWVDSSAAEAIVTRLGLRKVRHMEVKFLRAPEALCLKLFEVREFAGEKNPANVLTKEMSMREMKDKIESVGGFFASTDVSWTSGPRVERVPRAV